MKKDKNKRLILLLLLIAVFSICIAIWALCFKESPVIIAPDRVPEQESNAERIEDDADDKNDAPENGGAVSLTFSKDVSVNLTDKKISLYFANPQRSTHNVVLQIIIRDNLIAQSGTISPGNQVNELKLIDNAEKMLAKGGYDGKFVVHYYDVESGEKAVLNTEIPVNVKVN